MLGGVPSNLAGCTMVGVIDRNHFYIILSSMLAEANSQPTKLRKSFPAPPLLEAHDITGILTPNKDELLDN
jgi:hypothetical protein